MDYHDHRLRSLWLYTHASGMDRVCRFLSWKAPFSLVVLAFGDL